MVRDKLPLAPWLMGGLLLAVFFVRLAYLFNYTFNGDEFYTMLATQQTLTWGGPWLPSGLFYEKGLTYTYLAALLSGLTGFHEAMMRWPGLLAGVGGVALAYRTGRGLFGASLAGLVAATVLAFDGAAIEWGTRARMYTLAQVLLLLLILLTWRTVQQPTRRRAAVALLCLIAALLTHSGLVAALPGLSGAAVVAIRLHHGQIDEPLKRLISPLTLVLAGLALLLAIGLNLGSSMTLPQTIDTEEEDTAEADIFTPEPILLLEKYYDYFTAAQREPLLWLAVLAGLVALIQTARRSRRLDDQAAFFLTLSTGLTMLILLVLPFVFTRNRTIFLLLLPQVALLTSFAIHWLATVWGRWLPYRAGAWLMLALWLGWYVPPATVYLQPSEGEVRYDLAYRYVAENWQPGDAIADPRMAACYLYLNRCDYYLRESVVRGTDTLGDGYTDWYVGAPWIGTEADFSRIVADHERLWFVVREHKLERNFSPVFVQQMVAQLELVAFPADILIFRSLPQPMPLPESPTYTGPWHWYGGVSLAGYSLTQIDSEQAFLTLFWENVPRDDQFVVALNLHQANGSPIWTHRYFPLDEWPERVQDVAWGEGTALRNRVSIPTFPPDTGPLRLSVGIYERNTNTALPILSEPTQEIVTIGLLKDGTSLDLYSAP